VTRSPFSFARFLPVAALLATTAGLAGAQDSTAHRAKKILGGAFLQVDTMKARL
jgi:hypothetical protein